MSLSATEWPVGSMHCLLTETPLSRHKALRGRAVVLSLGWSLPWRLTRQGSGCSRKGSPRQVLFSVLPFFPPAIFEALSLLHAERCRRSLTLLCPHSQLTCCSDPCFVLEGFFFHKIIMQAALPWRTAELLPDFDLS